MLCFFVSALGITAGAHRLWSHRTYKASLPLRIFLGVANSMAFQVRFGGAGIFVPWNVFRRYTRPSL